MTIAAWWSRQWPYLLGACGVGGVAILAIGNRPGVKGSSLPAPPSSPPLPPGAPPRVWMLLDGNSVELQPGARYRGCVRLSWVYPTGVIAGKIGPALASKGFKDVVVTRAVPSDWPGVDCSIYVEATWARAPEVLARPGKVELAWESRNV